MSIVSRFFTTDHTAGDADVTPQEVLDALGNERRRNALRIIADLDDGCGVQFNEVVEMLASIEADGDSFDSEGRQRAYVSLYQTHVPNLVDAGFLEMTELTNGNKGRLHATQATDVALDVLDDIYERVEGER